MKRHHITSAIYTLIVGAAVLSAALVKMTVAISVVFTLTIVGGVVIDQLIKNSLRSDVKKLKDSLEQAHNYSEYCLERTKEVTQSHGELEYAIAQEKKSIERLKSTIRHLKKSVGEYDTILQGAIAVVHRDGTIKEPWPHDSSSWVEVDVYDDQDEVRHTVILCPPDKQHYIMYRVDNVNTNALDENNKLRAVRHADGGLDVVGPAAYYPAAALWNQLIAPKLDSIQNAEMPDHVAEAVHQATLDDTRGISLFEAALHDSEYNRGYTAGIEDGTEDGHAEGFKQGYEEGYSVGWDEGYKSSEEMNLLDLEDIVDDDA